MAKKTQADLRPKPAISYEVGQADVLWIYNFDTGDYRSEEVVYRGIGPNSAVAVQQNLWNSGLVSQERVDALIERFETAARPGAASGIMDIETESFGTVPPLGGDPLFHIVLVEIKDDLSNGATVFGYFSGVDQQPDSGPDGNAHSNYRNMVVIEATQLNLEMQAATLAHEYQHLIHYQYDAKEEVWFNEGASVYAEELCGYPRNILGSFFFENPRIGLFNGSGLPNLEDYEKGYMITRYLADRFGSETVKNIVQEERSGIAGIDRVLQEMGTGVSFEGIFLDWATANLLPQGHALGYSNFDPLAALETVQLPTFAEQDWLGINYFGTLYLKGGLSSVGVTLNSLGGDERFGARTVVKDAQGNYKVLPWYYRAHLGWVLCHNEPADFEEQWTVLSQWHRYGQAYPLNTTLVAHSDFAAPRVIGLSPTSSSGSTVSPYSSPIVISFDEPVDPNSLKLVVSGSVSGFIVAPWEIEDQTPDGPCGGSITLRVSAENWPPLETIHVALSGVQDLSGNHYGNIPDLSIGWSFQTSEEDFTPPKVSFGVLQHPEMVQNLHILAISNEALYPVPGIGLNLYVNNINVQLQEVTNTGLRYWRATVSATSDSLIEMVIEAQDLAGNMVSQLPYSYSLKAVTPIPIADSLAARPSTSGTTAKLPSTFGATGADNRVLSQDVPVAEASRQGLYFHLTNRERR